MTPADQIRIAQSQLASALVMAERGNPNLCALDLVQALKTIADALGLIARGAK
jgi:hypothetical protein